jgi:hypothetical protein
MTTRMFDRYEDCVSCAFREQDTFICESCDNGDQWEPADEDLMDSRDSTTSPIRFYPPLKKAA